jgi:hypothetical protein
VDGTECFKLKITKKGGKSETIFVDPKSYLILRSVELRKANGQEIEVATNYSNYEKLPEGIIVPKSMTLPFGELIISKITINGDVDETAFKK